MRSQVFVVWVNTNRIQPWAAKSWESLFFSLCKERNHNFRPLYNIRLKENRESENEKEKERKAGAWPLCCEVPLFYEAASRFSTCGWKKKKDAESTAHNRKKNQYNILTLVETSALTAFKHAVCQQTALRWLVLLILQARGGEEGICSDRMPHLETWLLHLLLEASTWILNKTRERFKLPTHVEKPYGSLWNHAPWQG